jgi:hypothetical protein
MGFKENKALFPQKNIETAIPDNYNTTRDIQRSKTAPAASVFICALVLSVFAK